MPPSEEQPNIDLASEVLAEARRRSLEEYLLEQPLVVGVSGGADSLALLHLLKSLRGDEAAANLHVAHLNHWFRRNEAREDAEFVRETAGNWGLSCTSETFDVPNYARRNKISDEDAARRVRYSFLASVARQRGAAVAVAHNADDQVETVLMSLLRGTGLGGLAGMQMLSRVPAPPESERGPFQREPAAEQVPLFRPVLHVWRHQIVAYCQQHGLQPRFDSTNWERTYRRNRVRHDLIPMLQLQYSLAIKDHLYNLAEIAGAENELVESVVDGEWDRTVLEGEQALEVRLDPQRFAALPDAMRRRVARRAIKAIAGTLQDITFEHVEATVGVLSQAAASPPAIHLPHGLIVQRRDGLGVVGSRAGREHVRAETSWPMGDAGNKIEVKPGQKISLHSGLQFRADLIEEGQPREKAGDSIALFDYDALLAAGRLTLRTREQGDFISPLGMDGRKSLQDLMVDAKIPRELRDRIAIVAFDGGHEVLWVPGRGGRRSSRAPVAETTKQVLQLIFSNE